MKKITNVRNAPFSNYKYTLFTIELLIKEIVGNDFLPRQCMPCTSVENFRSYFHSNNASIINAKVSKCLYK